MNDQMRTWLTRGAFALGIFVLGFAAGWMGRGSGVGVAREFAYQDWRLTCPPDSEMKRACSIATVISDPQSGRGVAEVSMGFENGQMDKRMLVVTVPIGVFIPPGVGIQIGADTQTAQYSTCFAIGCVATVHADDKLMESLKGAGSMNLLVADPRGRKFTLPVSMKGYVDAVAAMNSTEGKRHSWWKRLWS